MSNEPKQNNPLKGMELYKALKEAGYPQGGVGNWYLDPSTGEKYYIPQPSEIYTEFIADPSIWEEVGDTLARLWLEKSLKNNPKWPPHAKRKQ